MPDDTAQESWDLIAAPWHLDERVEDFPVPAGTRAIASPSLPAGSPAARMTQLHLAAAIAVTGG